MADKAVCAAPVEWIQLYQILPNFTRVPILQFKNKVANEKGESGGIGLLCQT